MRFPKSIVDQIGRVIQLNALPKRIVSLVPSISETLIDWNLSNLLVGITTFCPNPNGDIPLIGGTKTPDLRKIKSLNPDLILSNKEENNQIDIEELSAKIPTYVSDINNLNDALEMILQLGEMLELQQTAKNTAKEIQENLTEYQKGIHKTKLKKALYFVWRKPYMIAGSNTFIDDMIAQAGYQNIGRLAGNRYPEITKTLVAALKPDIIFLSSEPYRFAPIHRIEWEDLILLENIVIVDARYFSWYGTRLKDSAAYFSKLQEQLLS